MKWSPEQISNRLSTAFSDRVEMRVSPETIRPKRPTPAACGEFNVAQISLPEEVVTTGGGSTDDTENAGLLVLATVA